MALRTLQLFQGLPEETIQDLARLATMKSVPRNRAIVRAGERTDYLYFVLTGSLKVISSDEEGREVILNILGQGELFGEMGIFNEQPRSASVVSIVPTDLILLAKNDVRTLMQQNFEIAWRMMANLADRLRSADRRIESLALMDVYGRVARVLIETSGEVDGQTLLASRISKQDIAKMVGASREMVSRVMKDLTARGLIEETTSGIVLREGLTGS
ncbi:MAG: cyclic nucleotide-binding domain-containing protein [Rhodocyclaceae bacterium]|nr:cyclic nucleotide-binding domain-containing protein [Rhodocyclaceae bacterium]